MINIIAAVLYIIVAAMSVDHIVICVLSFLSGANLVLGIVQLKHNRNNDRH